MFILVFDGSPLFDFALSRAAQAQPLMLRYRLLQEFCLTDIDVQSINKDRG
jgi:hypothetical protein